MIRCYYSIDIEQSVDRCSLFSNKLFGPQVEAEGVMSYGNDSELEPTFRIAIGNLWTA